MIDTDRHCACGAVGIKTTHSPGSWWQQQILPSTKDFLVIKKGTGSGKVAQLLLFVGLTDQLPSNIYFIYPINPHSFVADTTSHNNYITTNNITTTAAVP